MLHFVALSLCRGKRSAPSVRRSPATNNRQTNAADRPADTGKHHSRTSKELWETERQIHGRKAAKCGMKAVISCLIRRPELTPHTEEWCKLRQTLQRSRRAMRETLDSEGPGERETMGWGKRRRRKKANAATIRWESLNRVEKLERIEKQLKASVS